MAMISAEKLPLRPIKVVWEDRHDADCDWCGSPTVLTWVIEAEPVPERFCSIRCFVIDTQQCWSPPRPNPYEFGDLWDHQQIPTKEMDSLHPECAPCQGYFLRFIQSFTNRKALT